MALDASGNARCRYRADTSWKRAPESTKGQPLVEADALLFWCRGKESNLALSLRMSGLDWRIKLRP